MSKLTTKGRITILLGKYQLTTGRRLSPRRIGIVGAQLRLRHGPAGLTLDGLGQQRRPALEAFSAVLAALPEDCEFSLEQAHLQLPARGTSGAEAGSFLVFATVDPSKGYKGITAFIVERDDPGFTVGKRESKLGIRASSTVELILDRCKLPADRVLGEVGKGYKIAIETLNEGRIGIGAQMLGVSGAALDAATRTLSSRPATEGPGK